MRSYRYVSATKTLDVVVCTHGDGDHAGGLVDLLKLWPGTIGQVWLPGRWVDVVPELLRDPKGFVDGLIKELDAIDIRGLSDGGGEESAADLAATMDDRVIAEREAARDSSDERVSTDLLHPTMGGFRLLTLTTRNPPIWVEPSP